MQKINFQNLPSTSTPLNATNLNAIQTNVENVFNGIVPTGNMVVESIVGKNLFNYQKTTGGWIDGNNTEKSTLADTYCYTEYIQVKPSTTYTLNFDNSTGLSGASILQYNNSRTFLNIAITEDQDVITFTTSSNTYYVRFTCRQDSKSNVQLEKGNSASSYSEYQGIGYVSGRNSNGDYIKFDDGTLIQWGTKNVGSVAITSQNGNLYQSDQLTQLSYPISFIDTPYRQLTLQSASGIALLIQANASTTTGTGGFYLTRGNSSTLSNVIVGFYSVGRWK